MAWRVRQERHALHFFVALWTEVCVRRNAFIEVWKEDCTKIEINHPIKEKSSKKTIRIKYFSIFAST
jgi:hypothetical protein